MKAEKEITYRKVADLHPLPNNPRKIKKEEMERLVDSITINGFWEHRPLALTEREGRLIVLCGNQRLKAARKLKINELPTILYRDLSKDEENELILRDNKENGEWDFDALKIDDAFKDVDFDFIGIEFPKEKVSQLKEVEDISNQGNEAEGSDVENNSEEENFYRSMFKDVLYESDNDFEIPTILYRDLSKDEENELILRDNKENGEWDFDALKIDDAFKDVDFDFIGIEFPKEKVSQLKEVEDISNQGNEAEGSDVENNSEEENFYRSMFKDVLYESDNDFEIPNLLKEMQAGKLELPLSPWGANSRLRKDVVTYHFYVDDYRFEALFKDPIKLLTSGCKAVVEPNCSCHDQTPIAWGIQLIYKKRWLARYLQECGIKVYADLNVSHKFIEYNKMGIPKGYNAFFTRGLDGWMESLKSDLQVAQEISGLECPNLIVYGGGQAIKDFCKEHHLLYVTDFINSKKI